MRSIINLNPHHRRPSRPTLSDLSSSPKRGPPVSDPAFGSPRPRSRCRSELPRNTYFEKEDSSVSEGEREGRAGEREEKTNQKTARTPARAVKMHPPIAALALELNPASMGQGPKG